MNQLNKARLLAGGLTLAMLFAFGVVAQTPGGQMKSSSKPAGQAKPAAAKPAKMAAAKSDTEIQDCITKKLAAAPKLKDQGFSATVANGVATFTGTANNAGSKGSVNGIAKSCGAKSVVNNITVKAAVKPAKAEMKKKP